MTAFPSEANHHHWWAYAPTRWDKLHALTTTTLDPRDEDAVVAFQDDGVTAAAACGRVAEWRWPGLVSRLSKPRCKMCCDALGVPRGDGTPANEQPNGQPSETPSGQPQEATP